jgi:hypothetical protein
MHALLAAAGDTVESTRASAPRTKFGSGSRDQANRLFISSEHEKCQVGCGAAWGAAALTAAAVAEQAGSVTWLRFLHIMVQVGVDSPGPTYQVPPSLGRQLVRGAWGHSRRVAMPPRRSCPSPHPIEAHPRAECLQLFTALLLNAAGPSTIRSPPPPRPYLPPPPAAVYQAQRRRVRDATRAAFCGQRRAGGSNQGGLSWLAAAGQAAGSFLLALDVCARLRQTPLGPVSPAGCLLVALPQPGAGAYNVPGSIGAKHDPAASVRTATFDPI